jgi:hypothetical protein
VVNTTLYSLASNSATYATAFHDITSGGNACNIGVTYCAASTSTSFAAGPGYDEASGLGSLDFNNLLSAWPTNSAGTSSTPSFTLSATAVSVTQTSTSSSVTSTSTITVTPKNGYTGTIAWTVLPSATIPNACYSLSNTTVSGSSAVTATLTLTTAAATCPSGATFLVRPGSSNVAGLTRPAMPGTPTLDARSLQQNDLRSTLSSATSSLGSGHSPAAPAPAAPATLAALGLAALCFAGTRRRSLRSARRLPTLLAILLLTGAALGLSGCGGGTSAATGTGTGTGSTSTTTSYTITVIGTDTTNSSITASTTLALSITQQ